jgi:hypothetical protein
MARSTFPDPYSRASGTISASQDSDRGACADETVLVEDQLERWTDVCAQEVAHEMAPVCGPVGPSHHDMSVDCGLIVLERDVTSDRPHLAIALATASSPPRSVSGLIVQTIRS